ncbi:hypothetical protein PENTCL1PPCAC_24740, partial [Pristionchus entomophagus]
FSRARTRCRRVVRCRAAAPLASSTRAEMWFEERSWSNLKLTDDLIEDWRDLWAFKIDFTIVAFSYVWATTNLLNLPKLILENGGLAFVAAYGACLLVCCLPVIVLELSIGQLTGRAPVTAFYNLSPIFKGVGVSQLLFTFFFLVVNTRYLGWLLLYIYHIFWSLWLGRPDLPWLSCRSFPEMISAPCREAGSLSNFSDLSLTKLAVVQKESSLMQFMSALERPTSSIDALGNLEIFPLVAYAVIWAIVFCAICFGVRWMGKVLPLFLIVSVSCFVAVLARSLFMGGIVQALEYWYGLTDWNVLMDYMVWKRAAEQALLATGCGFGAYISIASYCKRSNNLVKDSIKVCLAHVIFSALQVGLVISLTGYVYKKSGLAPALIIDKGEAQFWHILAYLQDFQNKQVWSGLLLLACALSLLAVFCIFALSLLAGLEDACGEKASKCCPRFTLAFLLCAAGAGASVIFATQAGRHWHELATGYLSYITIWVILAAELLAAGWFYCAHRLGNDLHLMLKHACCWCLGHFILLFDYLLPVVPIAIAVINARSYDRTAFSDEVRGWKWYEMAGAAIALVPLVPIPLFALAAMFRVCCCGKKEQGSSFKQLFGTRLRSHASHSQYADESHYGRHERTLTRSDGTSPPRYAASAPGYLRLPQAPLAEPETYNEV